MKRRNAKNGKEEEDKRNLWTEVNIPDNGFTQVVTCASHELSSYVVNGLLSIDSVDTKISIILFHQETKNALYSLLREHLDSRSTSIPIIRSNPQEIVTANKGVIHLYRLPISKHNLEQLQKSTIYLFSLDTLAADSVQSLFMEVQPTSSVILFEINRGNLDAINLPPAVNGATRAVEQIRKLLLVGLVFLAILYLLILVWKYLRKMF